MEDTKTWPDLAIGLYDKLTGRNAEISYTFEDLVVHVPSSASENAAHAVWKINGSMSITTKDNTNS